MTSPLTAVPLPEPEREDLPFPSAPLEELLRLLIKAARAHQLYLPNNPIYKSALDAVRGAFVPIWSRTDDLVLTVAETEIRWFGHPVLVEATKSSDSLPWLFYKDGVRELRIQPGFEETELVRLLDILQRVRKASPDDDDLLTLLWEADFLFLRYRYVDMVLEAAAPLADGGEMEPAGQSEVAAEARAAVEETQQSGIVNMSDFDATLYFLDEREIDYLQREIKREYEQDLRTNVVSILLDIFEQQVDEEVRAEVVEILDGLMVHMLSTGHFRGVALLLRETQAAAQRAPGLTPEFREAMSRLPDRLSAAEALTQMLQALDDAADLPDQRDVLELFDQLRPSALATILGSLSRLRNERLRRLLEQAAERLASSSTADLVRLISAPEREVAVEAIRRSGALKTQAAVAPLAKIMAGPDAELRQAAVLALTEIGSPGALQTLERTVDDPDRDVRVATVRALAARSYRPVLGRIEAAVKGKAIRDANLSEKMAFFESYGALCGDSGVSFLDSLLNGKGFLGRREDPELRACAAIALGRIATPTAMDALRKAANEKDVVVRNAVNRAMRGASA